MAPPFAVAVRRYQAGAEIARHARLVGTRVCSGAPDCRAGAGAGRARHRRRRPPLSGRIMAGFVHRGVIEGFYGPPYAHADRLWLIERLGAWGMNRYVYAPKDDPLHRAEWRTPYEPAALREFTELVARGRSVGVEVGFAVSQGLNIEYASVDDIHALQAKFRAFQALGA